MVRPRGRDAATSRHPRDAAGLRERGLQGDGELLAALDRPQHVSRPLARDGEPLRAHAEAAHVAAARLDRRRAHLRACRRRIGGGRNWDYRYTWIRDSSFTLYGLMRLGYTDEAAAFMRWVMARCQELEPDGSLQIMYGIDGRHELPEETCRTSRATWARARSVSATPRTRHLQLDIYGELLDSVYLYDKYGSPIPHDGWMNIERLIDWVCAHWRRSGREHLGGARRAPGVPLLAGDVLGGDRPRHPPRRQALVPGSARPLVRGARHDLPRHLRALLGSGAAGVRPARGRDRARRRGAAHAARALRVADRPALDVHAARASSRTW